jgi:acyl carrier protein
MEKYEKCKNIVIQIVTDYSNEIEKKLEFVDENTRLIGSSSPFDSSDLIQIIVEIEENINHEFGVDLTLTDEKAMSRTTSPFISVGSLINFIIENI